MTPGPESQYYRARVCRKGHVATSATDLVPDHAAFCSDCGSAIIDSCAACQTPIRGTMRESVGFGYNPPRFCHGCGAAFPWTNRAEMLAKIEDAILDEPGLDLYEKGLLKSELEQIEAGAADEAKQVAIWRSLKEKAPNAWRVAEGILINIASAAIRKQLGLP